MAESALHLSSHGKVLKPSDLKFGEGVKAAVDYRGDVTISMTDGHRVEGYVYNYSSDRLDLFPKNSPRAIVVDLKDVESLTFSGEDAARGKSYDDWVKKKEAEKASIKARPIE